MNVVCTYKKNKKNKFDHFQKKRFCNLIVYYHLFFKTGLLIFQIQFRSNKMFYLINWEYALTPSRTTALPPFAPWEQFESKRAKLSGIYKCFKSMISLFWFKTNPLMEQLSHGRVFVSYVWFIYKQLP